MKLLRYGEAGRERPGILAADGTVRDLSAHTGDIGGETLSPQGLAAIENLDIHSLERVAGSSRLGPCVANVGKLVCIGLNYRDHAEETGVTVPEEPVLFLKATSAICGPNDEIEIPPGSRATDWEVELGVVIGTHAKRVTEAEALSHVAGYCIVNDVSERDFQLNRGGQWTKGKSSDTFAPIGPWLVTCDEVADPRALSLRLDVNGERMQTGMTGNMVFGVCELVAYVSRFMSLQPGDIVSTGTPSGVGMGRKPNPVYLKPGDIVELAIDGLGEQRQRAVQG